MSSLNYIPPLGFHFLTPFYDYICELDGWGSTLKKMVIDVACVREDDQTLDVGCGTGTLAIEMKKQNPHTQITGIDPDKKALSIAHNKMHLQNVDIKFVEGFSQELPFNTSSFDLVISTLIFHHLTTDTKIKSLKQIYRVLKKNGRFILADFGKAQNNWIRIFYRIVTALPIAEASTLQDNIDGKLPYFIQDAGFQVTTLRPAYRGIQFLLGIK